jgi:hypothetical protein
MENVTWQVDDVVVEARSLLEMAHFSVDTARMALDYGTETRGSGASLASLLRSKVADERESAVVAVDAINHARDSLLALSRWLEQPEYERIGYEVQFWSTFEWAVSRLFTHTAHTTSKAVLRNVLVEALLRLTVVQDRLALVSQHGVAYHA